jgi:RNA 2',3'-cyclic 3'-phosphodiesterase
MRLFAALPIPDAVVPGLLAMQAGVPGARWSRREQLHLTLRFIGEVDGRQAGEIDDALSAIAVSAFTLEMKGVGSFGDRKPRDLWAAVALSEALVHLNRRIESALQRIGLEPEARKFTAHVTLARLKHTPRGAVADFLADHALYTSGPFAVTAFALYSSKLTSDGSIYRIEREYGLK